MINHILSTLMKSRPLYGVILNKTVSPQEDEELSKTHSGDYETKDNSSKSEITGAVLLHDLSLAIPFQCYSITLKHRLIDSLGSVSRFVLAALTQENVTLETIKKITALTDDHLEPFITRFIRLGWMKEDCTMLTQKGRAIAQATLLVDQSVKVWIDSIDKAIANPFILLSDSKLQASIADGVATLTPKQQGKARNAKHQKERIERFFARLDKTRMVAAKEKGQRLDASSHTKFLISIFEQKSQVILDNAADWYFEAGVKDEDVLFLMTTLPKGTPFDSGFNKSDTGIQFSLPCITCDIRFDKQSRKYFDVPNDRILCISLYSGALIERNNVMLKEPCDNTLGVYVDDEYCRTKLENALPPCSPLVSRTVKLEAEFYTKSISVETILIQAENEAMPWGREIIETGGG